MMMNNASPLFPRKQCSMLLPMLFPIVLRLLLLLVVSAHFGVGAHAGGVAAVVGEPVCAEGIAMDYFCIAQGFLFDNPSIVTLEGPFEHSVHCLIEVEECIGTPYEILLPPGDNDVHNTTTTMYTRSYRLDDAAKADVMALAKRVGSCGSCDGGGKVEKGLTVVVQGQVVAEAFGDVPPIISGTVTLSDPGSPVCTAQQPNPHPTPGTTLRPTASASPTCPSVPAPPMDSSPSPLSLWPSSSAPATTITTTASPIVTAETSVPFSPSSTPSAVSNNTAVSSSSPSLDVIATAAGPAAAPTAPTDTTDPPANDPTSSASTISDVVLIAAADAVWLLLVGAQLVM